MQNPDALAQATDAIHAAEAILIGAGAGMGVDSGLPDFRGPEGFWQAYPVFQGHRFQDISRPRWFRDDPELAWGFFGHRLNLYRATVPHAGFGILRRWGESCPLGYFVFTSNVDGQFQKAGFAPERVLECHGSIHHLQCVESCCNAIWPAESLQVMVDEKTVRARRPLPCCPHCGDLARPNVLMFGDGDWIPDRSERQQERYRTWLRGVDEARLVIIELGAGMAVPSVRVECECQRGQLIRVNPRDTEGPSRSIILAMGALEAIRALDELMA